MSQHEHPPGPAGTPSPQGSMTLARSVAGVLARLPGCLADEDARRRLMSVAKLLPAGLTRGPLGLELRLAGPTQVDLFGAVAPTDPALPALAAALEEPPGLPGWGRPEAAAQLGETLRRWAAGEGALPAVTRYVLIECDSPAAVGAAIPPPSVFLSPRGSRDVLLADQRPNAFHRSTAATTRATAELSGTWPDPTTAEALQIVVDALPEPGEVFAVGAMVSRDAGTSMRVAVRRVTPDGARSLLRSLGRPAQAEIIADLARRVPAPRHAVAFEVGPGAEQRVGLEVSPPQDWKTCDPSGWPALLDHLVEHGLAAPDRAGEVLGLIDAAGEPLWGLAHVKVAADEAGMLPGAKLYVGLLHR